MKSSLFVLFVFIISSLPLLSQSENIYKEQLQDHFEEYHVHTTDIKKTFTQFKNIHQFQEFELTNPKGGTWTLDLFPSNILAEDFVFTKLKNGKEIHERNISVYPYKGYVKGDPYSRVTLTVADGFLQGTVLKDGVEYTFQNLNSYVKSASSDEILVYENSKSIDTEERSCTLLEKQNLEDYIAEQNKSNVACLGLQLAYANDFLMYQSYGTGVLEHNVAIMNDAQSNFSNDFADEIEFTLGQIFVAVTAADDPWTNSTDLETFLIDFTQWGNSGGFNVIYDLATIWTERNFDGPPVGGAWTGGLCSIQRYNAIQDYTTNANLMRVVLAHEMGHNFGASHDAGGSGFIMAPAVNNTNTWSTASIANINSDIAGASCLGGCQGFSNAPVAEFVTDLTTNCSPVTINFTDTSIGDIVSWIWLFPGGEPSYSTEPNPSVFYATDGNYDVTLAVATDGGADEIFVFDAIELTSTQSVDFSSVTNGNIVTFTNNSVPLNGSFEWDFGDGSFSSAINPTHTYIEDGFYEVILTHVSGCGNLTFSQWVEISTLPIADFFTNFTFDCQPFTVEFLNNSSSNATSYFWEFEGGTPATSTEFDPIIVFNDPGVFDVSLTVTNDMGSDQFELFDYITVDPLPVAGFDFLVDMSTVEFTDNSTDANSVLWDFGDGQSAAIANPIHTYDMDGNYTVTQFVENGCGTNSFSETVIINNGPASVINYDTVAGCANLVVNFDGSASSAATSYEWSFVGGSPTSSTDVNPIVTYENAGTYDVSLIVSDGTINDTLEMLDLVTVNDIPLSMAMVNVMDMTVEGIAIPDGSMNTNYNWDFGDGNTATGDTVSNSYSEEEIYMVILSAENACGVDHDTTTINLYTAPTADFTADDTEGCAPLVVDFVDNSTNAITEWEWSFPGGTPSTSTMQNPSVTYESAGSYDVSLTVSNPSGTDVVSQETLVIIDDVPSVDFLAVNNLTTVTFTNQSSNATSFAWDFGDGDNSNEENPVHTYAEEGSFTVILTATNACGSVSETKVVVVNQLPTAAFLFDTDNGCIPFDVEFTNASSANVTSLLWTFEGGSPESSSEASPIVTYNSPGTFGVKLIVNSLAGRDTLEMPDLVIAEDVPSTLFIVNELSEFEFTFENETTNATEYLWAFGDGNTSIEINPMHTFAEAGEYTVVLTATNACGTSEWSEVIQIVESVVNEIGSISDLRIMPNPNTGSFQLLLDLKTAETLDMQIVNLLGQKMYFKTLGLKQGENKLRIDARDIVDGTYILSLFNGKQRSIIKFIVNK